MEAEETRERVTVDAGVVSHSCVSHGASETAAPRNKKRNEDSSRGALETLIQPVLEVLAGEDDGGGKESYTD